MMAVFGIDQTIYCPAFPENGRSVYMPGDFGMGDAIRGLAGKRSAVILAHHGPVVAGEDLEAAVFSIEELEETAKLHLLTRGLNPKMLDQAQVNGLVTKFGVQWDD